MANNLFVNRLRVLTQDGQVAYDERFHHGVNIIRGDNSSGKSTITHLLFYGLGGEYTRFVEQARRCSRVLVEVSTGDATVTLERPLDKDTEGLLLLTNEGGLAHDLLSPRHHVDKVYYARVAGRLTEEDRRAFEQGITLEDGLVCMPAGLEILSAGEESEAHVTLREGKFHQVKRMLASRGKPVTYLERIRMGNLTLDENLPRGGYRFLLPEEVDCLRKN